MKIALCFYGQVRSFETCYLPMYKNLIELYDTDVFLHTWKQDRNGYIEAPISKLLELYKPKKYLVESYEDKKNELFIPLRTDINNILNLRVHIDHTNVNYLQKKYNLNIDRNRLIDPQLRDDCLNYNLMIKKLNGEKNNAKRFIVKNTQLITLKYWDNCNLGFFSHFYSIYKSCDLKSQYEKDNNFKYDIVIIMRLDLFLYNNYNDFRQTINQNLANYSKKNYICTKKLHTESNDSIFIPYQMNYGGYLMVCDHYAYGPSNLINKYSNFYNEMYDHFIKQAKNNEPILAYGFPESNLTYHLLQHKIPITFNKSINYKILRTFKQIIIWGHKPYSHSHSWIHDGFEKAFKYLGFKVYRFDNDDDVSNFCFVHSLFITEGQVDQKMPKRDDCFYILHNCPNRNIKNYINLQTFTLDVINRENTFPVNNSKCEYYNLKTRSYYMPWATDLLPFEIENIKKNHHKIKSQKVINFVGSLSSTWEKFKTIANKYDIEFTQCGGLNRYKASIERNIELVQMSYIAPCIQDEWQVTKGYIPCRIFKNISYGQFGITNNPTVYELFDKKIIYNKNMEQLLINSVNYKNEEFANNKTLQFHLMDIIKNKHTYINRINSLLSFIKNFYYIE